MPKTTGKAGIGTVLKMGDGGSPQVFTAVANCTNLEAGGVAVNMIDATQLNSPDFYAEFIPGLKTADEWTFTLQWDPSDPTQNGTTGIRKQMEDRVLTTFLVDTSAIGIAVSLEADCYVSALANLSFTPEGIITMACTVRPSGAPREVVNV